MVVHAVLEWRDRKLGGHVGCRAGCAVGSFCYRCTVSERCTTIWATLAVMSFVKLCWSLTSLQYKVAFAWVFYCKLRTSRATLISPTIASQLKRYGIKI